MGTEAWKDLWTFVFFAASLAFYTVVVIVGIKGFGDMRNMVRSMLGERRGASRG